MLLSAAVLADCAASAAALPHGVALLGAEDVVVVRDSAGLGAAAGGVTGGGGALIDCSLDRDMEVSRDTTGTVKRLLPAYNECTIQSNDDKD